MTEIIPAILAKNFDELKEKISFFREYTELVQIDVCDGKFVSTSSWPMNEGDEESTDPILNEEEGMPYWTDVNFEFDLMVLDAHKYFEFFVKLGAKRIIFHLDSESDKKEFREFLESIDPYLRDNLEIGLAIRATTSIEEFDPYVNLVDFIQCMGIENIGHQGEPFDEKILNQIEKILLKYPDLKISVDGGVNEESAPLLVKKGVQRLVMGSALMKTSNIKEKIKEFESLS